MAYEQSEKSIKIPRIELEKLGIVMAEKSKITFHAENIALRNSKRRQRSQRNKSSGRKQNLKRKLSPMS